MSGFEINKVGMMKKKTPRKIISWRDDVLQRPVCLLDPKELEPKTR